MRGRMVDMYVLDGEKGIRRGGGRGEVSYVPHPRKENTRRTGWKRVPAEMKSEVKGGKKGLTASGVD